jgi:hypothetical protein
MKEVVGQVSAWGCGRLCIMPTGSRAVTRHMMFRGWDECCHTEPQSKVVLEGSHRHVRGSRERNATYHETLTYLWLLSGYEARARWCVQCAMSTYVVQDQACGAQSRSPGQGTTT